MGLSKELYFTPKKIHKQIREFKDTIQSVCPIRTQSIGIHHSALLVLDMQRYFLDATSHAFIPSAAAIIPGIQNLIDRFHRYQRPVVFTRHLNTDNNAGCMSKWWRNLIREQDPLSEITSELDTTGGTILIKPQYDAFHATDLNQVLYRENINQVVICGVMTHLCCETTARAAFVHGFDVFFSIDGTATYNRDFHTSTLININHGFGYPISIHDILAEMK